MAKDTKTAVDPGGPTEVDLPPTTTSTRAEAIRTSLGRFRIDGPLGQGGMGDVYRAHDPVLERSVALKVLRTRGRGDEEAQRRRMLREARAAAALSHPNTVTIFEVGEADGEVFLAMELLEGRGLRDVIAHGDAPLASKLKWLLEAARALEAAHARGLVHRDVKPENMFVCKGGTLKLLDFGIAKRSEDDTAPDREALGPSSLRTAGGVRAGTPRYMAPEQRAGASTDARTDEYAWGLVAFELLTGQHLLGGVETAPGRRDAAEGAGPSSLGAVLRVKAPEVPADVAAAIARALEPQQTERFATMEPLVRALERCVAAPSVPAVDAPSGAQQPPSPSTSPSASPTASPTDGSRTRRRRRIAGAAIALALACVAGGAALRARHPRPVPSCHVDGARSVPFGPQDRAAVLPGGAVVVARDVIDATRPARLEHDSSGTLVPFAPLGDADLSDIHIQGVTHASKPAMMIRLNQGPRGTLLALWRPDITLMNGVPSMQRLFGAVTDATAIGLGGADGVLVVLTGSTQSATESTDFSVQTWVLGTAWSTHTVLDVAQADAPAVAVNVARVAVGYRSNGVIRVLFVNRAGARVGDTLTAAKVSSRPVLAFAGDTLVVLWIEAASGTTRLRSAVLAPGATAFTAARDAIDEPVADIRPVAGRIGGSAPTVAWVAALGGRQIVRASPVDERGVLTGPSDVGAAGEVRSLGIATNDAALDLAWIDAEGQSLHVSRIGCGSR
jgi:predicted Ser/Thr protein kinase